MFDAEVLRDELVLGADVVVESNQGKGAKGRRVGGGTRLSVAEEGGDDDVVLFRVECFVLAGEPEVVVDHLVKGC